MIKESVKLLGLQSQLVLAFVIAQEVFKEHDYSCTITSVSEGKHKRGSLHYKGLAMLLLPILLPNDWERNLM